ncbi:BLOC-1-related complex subunit 5 [Zerene cesonia]|uniref:BLOC-1-related complex subunit 5 n=1 Tax=Zerene cesonia TaxID=33412 RepID=UPI0018E55195|nr:BLOC-1-related complex subunit 5 [Zerene cesonia]XP_038219892.1 BLOC-1-related complex subunit 5 [Zerene cesonia]
MGSEQSMPPKQPPQRAPPVRRGYTVAGTSFADGRRPDASASGNNSPGASMCSDSELPYISYTVDRPIGDSPKNTSKLQRDGKKALQRRQMSLQSRKGKRSRDIVVVKAATDTQLDEDIQRLQDIPTFLPIMRGTLGLPGARDPEVLEGLDCRPWVRLVCRLQAHLAACAHPLLGAQAQLVAQIKEADARAARLLAAAVERQRANARAAERLARARDLAHQLARCNALLTQTLHDVDELNSLLPEEKRLEPFVWNQPRP